jgi:hypothetical protein
MSKKRLPSSMAQSVRLSCSIFQIPSLITIVAFVVEIATSMIVIKGMTANRVSKPRRTNNPQVISNAPVNGPKKSGTGIPILLNLPAPKLSAKRNFWIPSDKKTAPTISRIRIVALSLSVEINEVNMRFYYLLYKLLFNAALPEFFGKSKQFLNE